MKLSWIAINGPPVSVDEACERLEIIADTYLSVSTPIQLAACRWLSMESTLRNEILNRVGDNWEKLQEQTELDVLNVEGGWSAIVRIPRTCPEETFVLELLKEEGVLVDPGAFYGFASEGYVVLSLLPLSKVFQQGIQGLAARVEKSNAQ